MHWCHWGPQEEEEQQQQRCWLGCYLWVLPHPPAELLRNVSPGVPLCPATLGGGTGRTEVLAWQTHGHCCSHGSTKQSNTVLSQILSRERHLMNPHWPLYKSGSAGQVHDFELADQPRPEPGTWGWSRLDFKWHKKPLTHPQHLSSVCCYHPLVQHMVSMKKQHLELGLLG